MFNISNTNSPIDKKELHQLLDEIITPQLEKIAFTMRSNYSWYSEPSNLIRHGFKYDLLKGEVGTFSWGACLNFIPMLSGSSIKYFRTEKAFKLQLFEWTDEYSNSFFDGSLDGGIATHWGYKKAKNSITELFNRYEEKVLSWFSNAYSIESLIEIAQLQVSFGKFYNFHHPSPSYILAFLYAKNKQLDKAIFCFDSLTDGYFDNKIELRSKLKDKLLELTQQ
jgi:hypothetical protein